MSWRNGYRSTGKDVRQRVNLELPIQANRDTPSFMAEVRVQRRHGWRAPPRAGDPRPRRLNRHPAFCWDA